MLDEILLTLFMQTVVIDTRIIAPNENVGSNEYIGNAYMWLSISLIQIAKEMASAEHVKTSMNIAMHFDPSKVMLMIVFSL